MNTPAATCPPSALIAAVRRHPLASFFILTFLFSWGVRVPSIFLPNWPAPISFMAMFGPAFAAVAVLIITGEQQKAASLFRSLFRWKAQPGWYLAAVLLPPMLIAFPILANRFLWPPAKGAAAAPALLPVLTLVLVNFAYMIFLVWGEEIGWRGFALLRLQAKMHPLAASAVLGLIWGVWHLPDFWIPGSSQEFIPIPVYLLYIFGHTFFIAGFTTVRGAACCWYACITPATNAFTVALASFPAFAAIIARPGTMLLGVGVAVAVVLLLTRGTLLAERVRGEGEVRG